MSSYKDAIQEAMTQLFEEPRVVAIGYNVAYGFAGGSLANVDKSRLIEMPLSENLMMGAAIGLSLEGHIPLVYFERMDFLLCALDSLVNHLDKLGSLSEGIHKPACIIRCVVGNSKTPLYTGATHCQNFTRAIHEMVSFPVIELHHKIQIGTSYQMALRNAKAGHSTMLVDFKDDWQT